MAFKCFIVFNEFPSKFAIHKARYLQLSCQVKSKTQVLLQEKRKDKRNVQLAESNKTYKTYKKKYSKSSECGLGEIWRVSVCIWSFLLVTNLGWVATWMAAPKKPSRDWFSECCRLQSRHN